MRNAVTLSPRLRITLLAMVTIVDACVDRIDFKIPPAELQIVVEGMITDEPGPYTVRVSKGLGLDADSLSPSPITGAQVTLFDDAMAKEELTEVNPGEYRSHGAIQGQVGHAYHIRLYTEDGRLFESEPDTIKPVGKVEAIRYEYEARTIQKPFGEVAADVFNIYLDSEAGEGRDNLVRWRYTGTYKAVTHPELHELWLQGDKYFKDPRPCSGYVVEPRLGGGQLTQIRECTCCTCWVNLFEEEPLLSDQQLISAGKFKHIKIAEVPINGNSFQDKFLVRVEQMSLTRKAFEFFRLVRAQKEGAASLFQPPSGAIRGNVHPVNSNGAVVGIFWATSVSQRSLFLTPGDVPYVPPPPVFVADGCTTYFPNSTTIKPSFWE